ncbi:MED14-domain-containing protein [Macrolepiota fuliginosa MF-IS2]|uniref:Mediator of RNA polymerase II transcription subunit 14 n=1 Tax=Macrolepiota fuliginosa MF-IS2 TaxID=1400762 RepID=A0A9P5XQE9_9AGAR|nr:MED14-domain-containing protein [Macrolepiota fuliginosa MF-IS2]
MTEIPQTPLIPLEPSTLPNGINDDVPLDILERELPVVYNDQIPLADLLQRVTQTIYAELSEMAETLPGMSDAARKRTLADWVVKTKKQVVKLYAVAKWSRDADVVQKCMNITAFLMGQNQQFEDVTRALKVAKDILDPARLRNHDLLTSLDVLTTGSYLRLPTCIKKYIIPPTPLTDAEVRKTLSDVEEAIRYRLRMSEAIPVEMAQYRIADGRVYFSAPNLFEASLCLRGADPDDGWFFVHVEFSIEVGGGLATLQEFPRIPTGILKHHITDEANSRLAYYLQLPELEQAPPGFEAPPRPKLPPGYVDAPLVRVFNFLQMMSLSYQLEILWYQAQRMRALGWANYMTVQMTRDRKSMTVSYWVRPPPPPVPGQHRKIKLPLLGGKVTVSIVETHGPPQAGPGPERSPKSRMLAKLHRKAKLGTAKPSDEVEGLRFEVKWEPEKGAMGVMLPPEQLVLPEEYLQVDSKCLDFEAMLKAIIEKHTATILGSFQHLLQTGPARAVFGPPGVVTRTDELGSPALRIHLCADELVIITIDPRMGRITLRDTGDLAAAGRGPRFTAISEKINEDPAVLFGALVRLRFATIADLAEQKAKYLGLQSYRLRHFQRDELAKLGPDTRGYLFIQLANFPNHYLVIVITDERFRFALITTSTNRDALFAHMVLEDIAWLNYDRIHQETLAVSKVTESLNPDVRLGMKRKREVENGERQPGFPDFDLETQMLRELYSYCCARVAYMNVERQLKLQHIPFTHVNPTSGMPVTQDLAHVQSSLARSVPGICVQSQDILSGVPAAEAAMPNIRVVPLRWWSEQNAQVVTCVKLKYVQQPMGKTAGGGGTIIRPSKRIIYDTKEAVVSFLSENVDTCVGEFLEEWARVSKMVVIAREVAQMSKEKNWRDIRLLSFDLQTVEFAYAENYTVSITCEDQLSPTGGNFALRFARRKLPAALTPSSRGAPMDEDIPEENLFNPHDDAEPFFRDILRQGHGRLAPSLHRLVTLLRETLPVVAELEAIRRGEERRNRVVDTFPKAAGWYRLLYGDLRHALDFRLMTNQRIAILDGSCSLHPAPDSTKSSSSDLSAVGLKPIPQFREIVTEVVKTALAADEIRPCKIARLDMGVVCECTAVRRLAKAIHARVAEVLATPTAVSKVPGLT